MSTVLLDTTVASLLHPKKKNNTLRQRYEPHMRGCILALSFQSEAELWAWAEQKNWSLEQRDGLAAFLRRFLLIPHDSELSKEWARVTTHCKKIGRRIESGDAWIAASALRYRIPLLTHDRDHTGLNIPNLQVISYV